MSGYEKSLKVWNIRSESVLAVQEALTMPPLASEVARGDTLYTLLRCLLDFGRKHFDLYTDGFHMDGGIQPHPMYQSEHPFNGLANKISYDLDIILNAIHHRTHKTVTSNQSNSNSPLALENADLYAKMLLKPAVCASLIPPVIPITYYQQGYCARVIPYAPVALIGIPFTANAIPLDLALVAHEVGHYVYSRMQAPGLDVSELPTWIRAWWEEIFADVYGCLVGGPGAAFALLNLQRRLAMGDLSRDDGEYPIPILRPTICLAALRRMARATEKEGLLKETALLEERITLLESERATWLANAPDSNVVTLHHGQTISIAEANGWLNRAVDILLSDSILGSLLPPNIAMNLWSTAVENSHVSPGVIGVTETAQRQLTAELVLDPDGTWATISQYGKLLCGEVSMTGLSTDLEATNENNARAVGHEGQYSWNPSWLTFLGADSWATKGPGPGNPQPTG